MIRQKRTSAAAPQLFRDLSGRMIQLGRRLGAGGEAEVFAIEGNDLLVAKIYKLPSEDRERKLQAMMQNPPKDPTLATGHRSICWPETILYDANNRFAGFLMSRIDFTTNRQLLAFYNPISRQRISIELTWQHLVRVAINVCSVVEAIHSQGHLIGDVNESNFLVSNSALVTLVDCDSIQVLDKQRNVRFRCPVGKAEFTPPELQDRDFSGIDRDTTHDYFSLGVITFLLLMEGVHPFMGSWRGYGNAPQLHENIKDGRFPYGNASVLVPSPIAPPLEILPGDIRTLFERCFVAGHDSPKARPTAQEWQRALKRLDNALQVCRTNGHHVFSGHLTQCPWCQRAAKLRGFDPFPLHEPQIPKPPAAVRQPRAAATATVQPQVAVKRTAEALRAAAPYVLFASVCVMAIGAWLYFNSPLGPAAVDLFSRWRYGEPPAISDLVGRSEPAQPAEPAESVDVEPEPLESTVAIRKSPRSPRSRTSAPRVAEPGVLVLPPRQNAGPNVVALEHLGSRTVEPSTRNEIVNSKASEPAASPASTVRGERTYNAKHKHRLGGCDGVLTLTADGIRYESKDHSFSFGIEETELDDDGITDPSGKNWHFSIKDTDVRTLIRQWRDGNLF